MSTILKALRRLEDDGSGSKKKPASPSAPDVDALRERILAEEAAARVASRIAPDPSEASSPASTPGRRSPRERLLVAAAGVAVVAALVFGAQQLGLFGDATPARVDSSDDATATSADASATGLTSAERAPRAMVAVPTPLAHPTPEHAAAERARLASLAVAAAESEPAAAPAAAPAPAAPPAGKAPAAPPTATTDSTPAPVAPPQVAIVKDAPATTPRAATAKPSAPGSPSPDTSPDALSRSASQTAAPGPSRPSPTAVLAERSTPSRPPAGAVAAGASPTRVETGMAATSTPRPAPSAGSPVAEPESDAAPMPDVQRVAPSRLPVVTVLRTAWHPKAERRSAKVRIDASGEVVNVQEGDAVAGLVIKEVTPSSVVFGVGGIEVRRRVGESASGGR